MLITSKRGTGMGSVFGDPVVATAILKACFIMAMASPGPSCDASFDTFVILAVRVESRLSRILNRGRFD